MIKQLGLLLLFISLSLLSQSQSKTYDFNSNCQEAYHQLLYLQMDSAQLLIEKEERNNPNNLIPTLLYNYKDFLQIVLTEDRVLFEKIKYQKSDRLDLWESGPENSPWYKSGKAQIKLQWAFTRVLFDEYFTAATEINSAYHLLEENKKDHPHFLADNMGIGILHAMIGVVPEQYQWAMEMLGLYGSIEQGVEEMKFQLNNQADQAFSKEALFYYTFVRLNLQTDSLRFQELINLYENNFYSSFTKKSPLLHFSKAALLLKINNDSAIIHLQNAPQAINGIHFYYSDFLYGQALLYKLEKEAAKHFELYIAEYKGKNYKKAALQKLAWTKFIHGDTAAYMQAMKLIAHTGAEILDADKVAKKESLRALGGILPNLFLLKSRLQFDGHYYQGALHELSQLNINKCNEETILEYHYRKGRIYHEMNDIPKAKLEYILALKKGRDNDRYFAANSALKLGQISEFQDNNEDAKLFYETVLDLDFSEYRKGIRAKAKAGLQRVKRK